jgi:hypothetical protein
MIFILTLTLIGVCAIIAIDTHLRSKIHKQDFYERGFDYAKSFFTDNGTATKEEVIEFLNSGLGRHHKSSYYKHFDKGVRAAIKLARKGEI